MARFDGDVIDRGEYIVVRRPGNPSDFWGNYLLFDRPPRACDVDADHPESWLALFDREIGRAGGHVLLVWEGEQGDSVDPSRAGEAMLGDAEAIVVADPTWELDRSVILTGDAVHPPPRWNTDLQIAPVVAEEGWRDAARVLVEAFSPRARGGGVRTFVERQIARYRRMVEARRGVWFGGALDGRMVGTLGIFVDGDVARFQLVGTSPSHAKRGVAGAMVHHAARFALSTLGAREVVIAADATYHAARVYESIGLRPREATYGLLRAAPRRTE
ncbi:MAG TPA: GNAT family N-acetyltransferase [Polyangiaceae bacterium]